VGTAVAVGVAVAGTAVQVAVDGTGVGVAVGGTGVGDGVSVTVAVAVAVAVVVKDGVTASDCTSVVVGKTADSDGATVGEPQATKTSTRTINKLLRRIIGEV
jgi:hypothetical protein